MSGRSAFEQARVEHPGLSDAALVETLAAKLGQELDLEPPIDLELLASAQGIGSIEVVDLPWSGCLIAEDSRLRVQLRSLDHPRRQRFTGCHEVSHTLLPGFSTTGVAYRCTPGDPVPAERGSPGLEHLADVAASEFLLPRRHVTADLFDAPFGWDTMFEVADSYEASLEATARRYVALSPSPAALLSLKPATSKRNPVPVLRVANRALSGAWPFIPVNKSVPEGHPLSEAQHGVAVDEVTELECLTGVDSPVQLSARLCPYFDNEGEQIMRVLAIAIPVGSSPAVSRG